ncbi:MAG: sugar phosphate nucleotidyltransferase [Thermoanaerobaculales bacterium]|jgi:NDP-sugar pyrophosphorylase family protein|nr:sugar phosphate nucleotidyltransferase [Thermoanaerobaculales bacterium]
MTLGAMVLAAGRGERMRPLSDALPKPALPATRRPVVASAVDLAVAGGAGRVVVNTWHLAELMERELATLEPGVPVVVSREPRLMGSAGALTLARDRGLFGNGGPLLVVNGDGLLNLDLTPLLHRMATTDDLVSLALLPHLEPTRWSRVELDPDGTVCRIRPPGTPEPGEVPLLYPGVMLVSHAALEGLDGGPGQIPDLLWRPALAEHRLGGVVVAGHWREVGTPRDYLEAVVDRLGGGRADHPTAVVDRSAAVGSALIGRDARVEARAMVGDSVVAEGATVGRGARVLRSVLLGAVAAAPGEVVVGEFRAAPR